MKHREISLTAVSAVSLFDPLLNIYCDVTPGKPSARGAGINPL